MIRLLRRAPRAGAALAAAVTSLSLLTGASSCGPEGLAGKPRAPRDAIQVWPADARRDVAVNDPLVVRVPDGRLESVRVVRTGDAREHPVPGRVSGDGLSWRPTAKRLAPAAAYRVDAVALDGHGRRTARHTTFRTRVPDERFLAYTAPENRATVGTGMIISLEFNRKVVDRAAVERAVEVTARPPVDVVGHWFGAERLDLRPETYWKPGTEVTVRLRLRDVEAAPGVHGLQDRSFAFTVGRAQTSVVDTAAHTLEVRRDGELLATLPATAGTAKSPTYNGKMVVTEMFETTRMNSRSVGFGGEYDIPDVPHAIRLTSSGTFLHGNYWAGGVFGKRNVSHGCVGLRDVKGGSSRTPAGWFFDRTLVGDVVEVRHSEDRVVAADNGLGGWNLDWAQWRSGSALP
ncbi:Ig-like domain-containing protein [Streptomyces sp. NPDC005955]|uniref:L,D-transpeptidase n=1 Tax=Streptomyces sp. NPDC005955 TaxID=3364738 RepID=UPI0036C32C50